MLLDRLRRRRSGPRPRSLRPTISRPTLLEPALPRLVFAAIAILSIGAGGLLTARARAKEQARFERMSSEFELSAESRLAHYVDALRATAGLFDASETVGPEEFRRFVRSMSVAQRYPGIQGIGFAEAARRPPLTTAIRYLEPPDARNRAAMGYDMYAEPERRRAMDAAVASGRAAATDRVRLLQEIGPDQQWGFIIYFPVFRDAWMPASEGARRAALRGFVYAPFRAGDFFTALPVPRELDFAILEEPGRSDPIFSRGEPRFRRLRAARSLDVAGRSWVLETASQGLLSRFERFEGLLIASVGVLLGLVFMRLLSEAERRTRELREAVAARRESERRFRLIADASPALIWTAGPDGGITWYSRRFFDYTGLDMEGLLGDKWGAMLHPDDLGKAREIYTAAVRSRVPYSSEFRLRRNDGAYRWFHLDAAPFVAEDGLFLGFVGACMDVQESRELELELERRVAARTEQLQAANKELESFAYSVSHDLRAPLRTIEGFSAVLVRRLGDKLDGEDAGHFRRIRLGVERMGAIIDDLLKFSRMQRAELRPQPVDVTVLARAAAAEAARANPHAATLTIQAGLSAVADPALLRIALDNLLSNAYKYSSKTPNARVEVGREDGAFFVRDNGAGFDMAHVEKLFQPFSRLHTREEFEGTGVGLAIVKRIIERHGGRVWVESKLGEGSTFRFTLGEAPGEAK